jgi:mono/diheme cytochrome c family protein
MGVILLLSVACGREPRTQDDPLMDVFRRAAQEEGLTRVQSEGKRLFAQYCVTCHGERGEGDGQNAFNLDPAPPNFVESLSSTAPSDWRQIIEEGSGSVERSPLCPPFGRNLSQDDVDGLVAYLERLATANASSPEG